jgi:hypothetical protein
MSIILPPSSFYPSAIFDGVSVEDCYMDVSQKCDGLSK